MKKNIRRRPNLPSNQPKGKQTLEKRLDELIAEMEHHKDTKDLAINYYVVLREMRNLRDGVQIGS